MKRALRLLLAGFVTLVCGIAGVAIAIATAPAETSIDEGWRLAWIGLGGGALLGAVVAWLFLRRTASRRDE